MAPIVAAIAIVAVAGVVVFFCCRIFYRMIKWLVTAKVPRIQEVTPTPLPVKKKRPSRSNFPPAANAERWAAHPEYALIKSRANGLVRLLDLPTDSNFSAELEMLKKIAESYRQLCELGFIDQMDQFGKYSGISEEAMITLPPDLFASGFIGHLQISLSNLFNNGNKPELNAKFSPEKVEALRDLLQVFRVCFAGRLEFAGHGFLNRPSTETVAMLQADISYQGIGKAIGFSHNGEVAPTSPGCQKIS